MLYYSSAERGDTLRRYVGEQDAQDHRLWPSEGSVQDHQNVGRRDLRLDATRGNINIFHQP